MFSTVVMYRSNAESQFAKLPSFMSYCKSAPEAAEGKIKVVETIWLPNKFASISFDTESYRLRITESSSIYLPLVSAVEQWELHEDCLAIRLCSKKDAEFEIELLEGESCTWEELGQYGRKLTVKNKTKSKRK